MQVRYAAGALQNMLTALQGQRLAPHVAQLLAPLSADAQAAVQHRAWQARVDEFAFVRAKAVLARHVRNIPRKQRLQRLLIQREAAAAATERRLSDEQVQGCYRSSDHRGRG